MTTLLAESYLHRLDPFAIQFTDTFGLRWYGLSYAAGFVISWLIIRWLAATNRSPLTVVEAGDLMFSVIVGVILGGRLGYAAFYDPSLFGFSADPPWWNLLAITKGGMASHGGIVGVILACWVFARRRGGGALHLYDLVAFTCLPGLGLGRVANFVNGELWGRALPAAAQADPPGWSVKYPGEVALWSGPEAIDKLAALDTLRPLLGGDATFVDRVIEAARGVGDPAIVERVTGVVRPLLTAYYPSQLVQAAAEGPVLLVVLAIVWWKPRRPGVVGSTFLVAYGVLRVLTETVRQPDPGVALLLGLSRGQTLSALMVAAGLVCLVVSVRRPGAAIGGLGAHPPAAG